MKNLFKLLVICLFFAAQQVKAQGNAIFPKGEKAANVHHVGNVWLKELNGTDSVFNNSITVVTMEAGSRLDWHKHLGGQILMIMDGEGYYQERNKPRQTVRKGEVVKCMPHVEHWHGATPHSDVTYLANSPTQHGKTVWLEKLSDQAYFGNENDKEQTILKLSKDKWLWMANKNVDSLNVLFDPKSVFVHMGGNMTKEQELDVIKTGRIQYKNAEIQEVSVQFIENTAILLNKIRLTAIVGGNEVVNPFTVTEVYVFKNGRWALGSLSFTKLLTP